MPLPRSPALRPYWVPRQAEAEFLKLLEQKCATVWPITGAGGVGKTSLLQRFFQHCQQHKLAVLRFDLSRLNVGNALDLLLQIETAHTPRFDAERQKLRASYETLGALLQSYGGDAAHAADLLQKTTDEDLGIVFSTARDAVKLAAAFLQREENRQQQRLLRQPEESLLRALAEDLSPAGGVILVDTLERTAKQNLPSRLQFREDGDIGSIPQDVPANIGLLDYCAGLAHFLFDQPVLLVLAGRPAAIRELGALPPDYFAPTLEVPAFTDAEIRSYLAATLPRLARPRLEDLERLRRITHGNPFLLERVVRLLADWRPEWAWQDEQWQPLLDSFESDERHGLLLYVTQRLASHMQADDRLFWRLALPRRAVHREQAALLFGEDPQPLQRLEHYADQGIVYRGHQSEHDDYFLHDETRAALEAWAKREKLWLDASSAAIHAKLAVWFDQRSGWPERYPEPDKRTAANGNPWLLEAAYHALMADTGFEQRYPGHSRLRFWQALSALPLANNGRKRSLIAELPNAPVERVTDLEQVCQKLTDRLQKIFKSDTRCWLEQHSARGSLPWNWHENTEFLDDALKHFPEDTGLITYYAECLEKTCPDRAEELYRRAVETDPNHAANLGRFAVFMQTVRQDADRAEELFRQAEDADPGHAVNLGNFAVFMHTAHRDAAAEELFRRAVEADPGHAHNLGNFARFMETVRQDADAAEELFRRAIEAGPGDARNLGMFATFMETVRRDAAAAEELYRRAVQANPNHADNLGNFATFMHSVRRDADRAEELFRRAVEAEPGHAVNLGNFATFMHSVRRDAAAAEALYRRAVEADPNNANNLGNFAVFMHSVCQDGDRAEELFQQAVEADPGHAYNLGNFAQFMHSVRQDHSNAAALYRRAIEAGLNHASIYANYAQLRLAQGDQTAGRALLELAIAAEPTESVCLEIWFYRLAHFPGEYPQAEAEIRALLAAGVRSAGWDFAPNIAQARREGHPDVGLLETLAAAISQEAADPAG